MATSHGVEYFSDVAEGSSELPGLLGPGKTTGSGQQQATLVTGERKEGIITRSMTLRASRRNGRLLCTAILVRAYEILLGFFLGMGALVSF
jgi:hypothetical protein